jgi:predicted HTH domain antitoxin
VIIGKGGVMTKTVSVAELGHGGASQAIRQAQDEPVLVSKGNRPAAWIVSAEKLARVAAARGGEPEIYHRALELLAIDLYEREILTLGQAAKLAGMDLGDFIDLCGRLHVPILWEPDEGIASDVDAWSTPTDDRTSNG